MAKTGRPTTYNQAIADANCEEMANTDRSLERICSAEGMPEARSVYRWLNVHEDFRQQYARARPRLTYMAAQTVDIADDVSKDNSFAVSVAVARSRLRIDARKWL